MQPFITLDDQLQSLELLSLMSFESIETDYTVILMLEVSDDTLAENYLQKQLFLHINYRGDADVLAGIVTKLKKLRNHSNYYEVTLRPRFSLLTTTEHSRTFVDWTVLRIIRFVLRYHHDIAFDYSQLRRDYGPLDYVVQYGESDYYFLKRLMAEQGIFYYYRADTLVLCDDPTGYVDYKRPLQDVIRFRKRQNLLPEALQLLGRPATVACLSAKLNNTLNAIYPNLATSHLERDRELIQHCQRYQQTEMEVHLVSDYLGLHSGSRIFKDQYYVVKEVYHQLYVERGVVRYSNQCYCIPAERLLCLPLLPRPMTNDQFTADVTAIETGNQLRVKLCYTWDERRQDSPWCRVRQYWCGDGYGAQFLPQRGDAVLVRYVNGDLTRPIVMGAGKSYFDGFKFGSEHAFCALTADQITLYSQGLFSIKSQQQLQFTAQQAVTIQSLGASVSTLQAAQFLAHGKQSWRLQVGDSYIEMSDGNLTIAAERIELN